MVIFAENSSRYCEIIVSFSCRISSSSRTSYFSKKKKIYKKSIGKAFTNSLSVHVIDLSRNSKNWFKNSFSSRNTFRNSYSTKSSWSLSKSSTKNPLRDIFRNSLKNPSENLSKDSSKNLIALSLRISPCISLEFIFSSNKYFRKASRNFFRNCTRNYFRFASRNWKKKYLEISPGIPRRVFLMIPSRIPPGCFKIFL